MNPYSTLTKTELQKLKEVLLSEYNNFKAKGLKLDMSRGKPADDQLALSDALLDAINSESDIKAMDGTDCRNYGLLDGIPECKLIFSQLLGVSAENVIIGGNSSLSLMFDYISQCITHGPDGEPWCRQGNIKFACPSPGYDRHFSICEYFGIEMVIVPMLEDGPDMDVLEELVKDSTVKGMICVPKYSNPEGTTFSNNVVRRIAALKPAARDFRIIWDNAYCIHDLNDTPDELLNIFDECEKHNNEDMVISFTSTSKVSFPGAGISAIGASAKNITEIKKRLAMQTIGYDKLNQLRHGRFFKDIDSIKEHMVLHAKLISPKFNVVLEALKKELAGIAKWSKPNGGYFVSLNVMSGCAERVVQLCKEAGVVLTPAGATYPYGKDPEDKNIRIAPTFPPVSELEVAVELLCIAVKLATVEKIIG